jgi:hypothetical protein
MASKLKVRPFGTLVYQLITNEGSQTLQICWIFAPSANIPKAPNIVEAALKTVMVPVSITPLIRKRRNVGCTIIIDLKKLGRRYLNMNAKRLDHFMGGFAKRLVKVAQSRYPQVTNNEANKPFTGRNCHRQYY